MPRRPCPPHSTAWRRRAPAGQSPPRRHSHTPARAASRASAWRALRGETKQPYDSPPVPHSIKFTHGTASGTNCQVTGGATDARAGAQASAQSRAPRMPRAARHSIRRTRCAIASARPLAWPRRKYPFMYARRFAAAPVCRTSVAFRAHGERARRRGERVHDRRIERGRKQRPRQQRAHCVRDDRWRHPFDHVAPPREQQLGIRQRAMAHGDGQAVRTGKRVEIVVRKVRTQAARQHHRAHHLRRERDARGVELRAQEGVVEASVVRHHQAPLEPRRDESRNVGKAWRVGPLVVARTRRRGRVPVTERIDHGGPAIDAIVLQRDHRHLGDPVGAGSKPRGLDIDEGHALGNVHRPYYLSCRTIVLRNVRSAPHRGHFRTRRGHLVFHSYSITYEWHGTCNAGLHGDS